MFTPCRLGRRSPPLCGNVRVGPPAMSFIRTVYFLRRHFCGDRNPALPITDKETVHKPNSSLRPGKWGQTPIKTKKITKGRTGGGVFFERKRRKKAHRTGRPKRDFKELQKCQPKRTGRPKRDFNWQAYRQQQECQPQRMGRPKRDLKLQHQKSQ